MERTGKLNYMLVLKTSLNKFTIGAWVQDTILGINNLLKWRRAAIVTDNDNIIKFTSLFSKVMPGEYRGFKHSKFNEAVAWVAG